MEKINELITKWQSKIDYLKPYKHKERLTVLGDVKLEIYEQIVSDLKSLNEAIVRKPQTDDGHCELCWRLEKYCKCTE